MTIGLIVATRRGCGSFAEGFRRKQVVTKISAQDHLPGTTAAVQQNVAKGARDIRVDFFRGMALIFIFLDHIPDNNMNWITIRNFGFSDATEIFVFISGYSAAKAYSRYLERDGILFATARILKRCWQLYVTQLLLFLAFTAQVAYTAAHFSNPMFSEEMNIVNFLNEPHVTILQALLLRFRPANMDILPLYIVLLGGFPLILWGLARLRWMVLLLSAVLYLAAGALHWNLSTWPDGVWLFNPFTWQFLFVLGAACGLSRGEFPWLVRLQSFIAPLAVLYLSASCFIAMGWRFPLLQRWVPDLLEALIYPIDKTNLDVLRLLHFFALAFLVRWLIPANSRLLTWRPLHPVEICGQHSLEIFSISIFLSFLAHLWLVEVNDSLGSQLSVSLIGFSVMAGFAYYLHWYHQAERKSQASRAGAASLPSGGT
ncbi:MAG TPA: OpgC domain-containing protein, partial [Rhodospirillaceae bacterium]|nr:OpgC domain-containing protein [Rhodospirillaceae bacterium]